MFGIGFFELVVIAVVALIFVGPKKLPEVMRQAGKFFVQVRRTANDVRSTFDQVVREAEDELRKEEMAARQALLDVPAVTVASHPVDALPPPATTPPGPDAATPPSAAPGASQAPSTAASDAPVASNAAPSTPDAAVANAAHDAAWQRPPAPHAPAAPATPTAAVDQPTPARVDDDPTG
jgi:sec-independent protein translocase protein TatB